MKRISDFTQEEIDAINLDDYEPFCIDLSEYPGVLEAIERICNSEQDVHVDVGRILSLEELRKWWILTHPNEVKRKIGKRLPLYKSSEMGLRLHTSMDI